MIKIVIFRPEQLEKLHFCKENKVKYRMHLTIGMMATTGLYLIGVAINEPWMGHASTGMNLVTAMMWIWE